MRIIFIGSAPLSCPSLEALPAKEVVAIVTQPDRPKGRTLKISPSAVKVLALGRNLSVLTPENVNTPGSIETLRLLKPDLIVVVAYGQILRAEVLNLAPKGCVNMHASLLPKYRGAAPIQWAIANGEQVTGVTTIFMNEKMDAGDIIMHKEVSISHLDTAGLLHDKLAEEGAVLLAQTVDAIRNDHAHRTPQVDPEATFAPKLKKEDGKIDWMMSAKEIYNRVRGFNPWPCCWCVIQEDRRQKTEDRRKKRGGEGAGWILRVLKVGVEEAEGKPGEVVDISGQGPLIGAGDGCLRLLEVQPVGKKVMSGAAYLRGHGLKTGDKVF